MRLAHLSRLKLSEEEVEKYRGELSKILSYVETLNKVDTKNVPPTYQVTGLTSVMRDDEPIDYEAKSKDLLKNAPALSKNQFKVKRVL